MQENVKVDQNSQSDSQDSDLQFDNLPNRLTMFRIFCVPVVVSCLLLDSWQYAWIVEHRGLLGWIAAWTFVVASISDFFDGYIARKRKIVTIFGSFLDPIADKFLVVSSLIMLLYLDRIHVVIVVILILREMYMTSLRLLAMSEGVSVPVNQLGKWKTVLQMVGIPMLMANAPLWGIPLRVIGPICIYISVFLSTYSAFKYTLGGFQKIKARRLDLKKQKKAAQKGPSNSNISKTDPTDAAALSKN